MTFVTLLFSQLPYQSKSTAPSHNGDNVPKVVSASFCKFKGYMFKGMLCNTCVAFEGVFGVEKECLTIKKKKLTATQASVRFSRF